MVGNQVAATGTEGRQKGCDIVFGIVEGVEVVFFRSIRTYLFLANDSSKLNTTLCLKELALNTAL